MPKTIMLAGAPEGPWQDEDLTVDQFLPIFAKFIRRDDAENGNDMRLSSTVAPKGPVWRSVSLKDGRLVTGLSQQHWNREPIGMVYDPNDGVELSFITGTDSSAGEPPTEDLTQYLQQSLALHEDLESSRIGALAETPLLQKHLKKRSIALETPLAHSPAVPDTLSTIAFTPTPRPASPSVFPLSLMNLTDLSLIPDATRLAALNPQTVTVDLIVGVITVSSPRRVIVRRTARETELVEVLVGDDTRAGFQVTFWLDDESRDTILELRAGHVLYLNNIALNQFKGVTRGQSLGGKWRGAGATRVVRLKQETILPAKKSAQGPQGVFNDKVNSVRRWASRFIRPDTTKALEAGKSKLPQLNDTLPLDETPR